MWEPNGDCGTVGLGASSAFLLGKQVQEREGWETSKSVKVERDGPALIGS